MQNLNTSYCLTYNNYYLIIMAALEKKPVVKNFYNLVPVYFQLIHNIWSFMYMYRTVSKLGDYVMHFPPPEFIIFSTELTASPASSLGGWPSSCSCESGQKNAVSFLIETFKVRSSYIRVYPSKVSVNFLIHKLRSDTRNPKLKLFIN